MVINANTPKDQLVAYLRDMHGIDMPDATQLALLAKASELDGVDYSLHSDHAVATDENSDARAIAAQGKRTINIPSTEAADGQAPVFVGVNGVHFLIQRDTNVDVPESVLEALRNAKQTVYKLVNNDMVPREVMAYPFSVVG